MADCDEVDKKELRVKEESKMKEGKARSLYIQD